jgi:hypothetical protein
MPIEPDQLPAPKPSRLGEMAALVRAHDWSKTPLGPAETWPPSLRLIVDMMNAGAPNSS